MLQFKQYQIGKNPHNLIIFLHGYNGNLDDHQYAIDWMQQYFKNCYFLTPLAPEVCDKNPQKKQWFGMEKYDADMRRKASTTSIEKIFAIYETTAEEIAAKAYLVNEFITKQQKKFCIDNAHTFLLGFSQGAMLAIYTALTRAKNIGGVFAFSGLVAGKEALSAQKKANPPIYMFHGVQDMQVQYKTLAASLAWLSKNNIVAHGITYDDLKHRINEDEIKKTAYFIAQLVQTSA